MSKRKKNKNNQEMNQMNENNPNENISETVEQNEESSLNPFSEENVANMSEKLEEENNNITDDDSEEVIYIDDEEETSNDESATEEDKKENKENKEEKKGLFDGLFKKSDEELKKVKEAYATLNNQYLRLAADFENFRKRQESEKENLIKYGTVEALKKMILVADNFDRAEKAMETIDDVQKAKEAFNVLSKQFKESLQKLGLEEINAQGQQFDPNLHEALMQVPTDEYPEDTVVQEMQKGYKYGDKILRPSMVSVAVSKDN